MADIIVGGVYNGPGVNVSVTGTSPQTLNMTDAEAYVAGYKVTGLNVWVNSFSAAGASMAFNIYNVTGGASGAPKIYEVVFTIPAGLTANGYVNMPLDAELPGLSGGEILAIGRTSKIAAGTFSTKAAVGTSSTATAGQSGPNPWSQLSTTTELYDAHFVLSESAPTPTIESINSGAGIVSGSAGNAMVVSGFASPVTVLTVGGLAMTAVTNASGDNYTFADPGFIDGSADPGFGSLSAVASNSGETSAGFSVPRSLDSSLTAVVLSTLSADPETIALKAALQGLTISPGDTLYSALTIYDDGTISDADDGDHEVWHRDEATDIVTLIIVTVGAGEVISVGITMRALTGRNVTMKNLTMRSL